jgi:hypothetical protein
MTQDVDTYPAIHGERGRTQKDLDHACLRTLVVITNGLVLRSTTETAEATPIVVRARLFQKYLALLIRALERGNAVTDVRLSTSDSVCADLIRTLLFESERQQPTLKWVRWLPRPPHLLRLRRYRIS